MNRNRLLIGIFIAVLLAFLTSTFVYKKFQQASFIKRRQSPRQSWWPLSRCRWEPGWIVRVTTDSVARRRASARNVHKNG